MGLVDAIVEDRGCGDRLGTEERPRERQRTDCEGAGTALRCGM